jgi:hypothetical protein
MAIHNYKAGLGNVGSYQVSGKPFAKAELNSRGSSALEVTFPTVTRWLYITNHDTSNPLSCSFSANGLTNSDKNFWRVAAAQGERSIKDSLEVKVTAMYFSGSSNFDIVAGLTSISVSELATNWTGSAGVG